MQLNFEYEFELYGYGESLASQIVRMCLSEKELKYKNHRIGLESTGEHLHKSYKKINPKCLVPTLLHNGCPIHDSVKIIDYLDNYDTSNAIRFFSDDVKKNVAIRELVREFSLDESISVGENFGTSVAGISTQILAHLICKRPLLSVLWDYTVKHPIRERALIFILMRILGKPPSFKYRQFVSGIANGVVYVEKLLDLDAEYIMGEYSVADVILSVLFHRLEITAFHKVLASEKFPNVKSYWNSLKKRPSYTEAIINFEEEEWTDSKTHLYGAQENPEIEYFWSEVDRLKV